MEALSKAEQNALSVSYDVLGAHVELDIDFVKRYLVRGRAELVSDQELVLFMNTCKMQGLNPLMNGEFYLIKNSKDDPAQMVVGKGAYLRRAYDHPDYICKEDGIVVRRGDSIVQKEGCCLYPGEELIGGWCRTHFTRNGTERSVFKEVSYSEYNKGQANWKSKPATMINKVAVSQCLREAFPKDYEGLYSEDEMIASGAIPAEPIPPAPKAGPVPAYAADAVDVDAEPVDEDPVINQEQRQTLFRMARQHLGEHANDALKVMVREQGYESTAEMRTSAYKQVMKEIVQIAQQMKQDASEEGQGENADNELPA